MKCTVCREPAVIDLRRHNANFCVPHLQKFCTDQVARAIEQFDMFGPADRVLVAVSGGKDSLAAWDILRTLGYDADGLYIGLGIEAYSDESASFARRFATDRGAKLIKIDLPSEYGYDIPGGARAARRTPCSACGLSKRHLFDTAARDGGYDVVVTGHNLDDEAAVLFGNVLHWQVEYLGRQRPVLPAHDGFPRKAKPLVRLSERETAAFCIVSGIDYQVEECPMAKGNRHLGYKDALNTIELQSPGSKAAFYFSFQRDAVERFATEPGAPDPMLRACASCGAPCSSERCAFCRLAERAAAATSPHGGAPADTPVNILDDHVETTTQETK
jgi:uncharacterized protein (TIGR00269 family)